MTTGNNGNKSNLGGNWGKTSTTPAPEAPLIDPSETPEEPVHRRRNASGIGSTRQTGREARKAKVDPTYVNVGRSRRFSAVAAQHTSLMEEKFAPVLEAAALRYPNEKIEMNVLLRDEAHIPYDAIVLHQISNDMGQPVAYYYVFIMGQSNANLTPLSYDNPYSKSNNGASKFTLPNVAGDVPNDNVNTIDTIADAIEDSATALFGTTHVVLTGVRVIEAEAKLDDVEDKNFTNMLDDAAEIISTYLEQSMQVSAFDWSNMATMENGNAVVNDIDYKPTPLKSDTGMPIHRQLTLTTSGLEKSYDGNKGSSLRTISEISAFIDNRYGEGEYADEPQWMPVAVISNFATQCGGNILHHILIGVANMVQLKDDYQFLPALDWRKKDPFNDITMMGNLIAAPFDIKEPGPLECNSTEDFFNIAKRAYVPSLEIAMDVSNVDSQSWLGPFFAGAAIEGSDEYNAWIDAANQITGNQFDRFFFKDNRETRVVLDDDNFQIGGNFRGADQELHDPREVGHLAVIANFPNDPRKVEEYDDVTIGNVENAPAALRSQLDIKTEICGRVNVTAYIRRFTFAPEFLIALYEGAKANGTVAPLDGAMRGPSEKRQFMRDLYSRGVESRNAGRRRRGNSYEGRY